MRGGQYQIHGSFVNVPCDIAPLVHSLPRLPDKTMMIPLQLKRRLSYKSNYLKMNIRPRAVLEALQWLLKNGTLFKEMNLSVDEEYLEKMLSHDEDQNAEIRGQNEDSTSNTSNEENDSSQDQQNNILPTRQDNHSFV